MPARLTIPTPSAAEQSTAIEARSVTLAYGSNVALRDLSIDVPDGSTVAVIGPNGSGKSTLLRAIAGLHEPEEGHLRVPAQRRRGGVAMVLQSTDVDRALPITVAETVRLGRYSRLGLFRRFRAADRLAVDHAMRQMRVDDLASAQFHELSGGQRQRVLIAQGLAQDASLILLDEPVTGLDLVSRERIFEVVNARRDAGQTVVLTSHSLDDAQRCDLVLLLAQRMIAFGPPHEVLTEGPLAEAFGDHALRLDDGTIIVDDPHHGHG